MDQQAKNVEAILGVQESSRRGYKRRLVKFLRIAEPCIDLAGIFAITAFFIYLLPLKEIFSDAPATGGDMGSHYWPLFTLVHYAIPHGALHTWNPGNLGGEPHLVHYFPFPFLVMAAMSSVVPLATAFNIGSLLALLFLPIAVYIGVRLSGLRFPAAILSAVVSLSFLYNESFSMWGGNTLSTLAGQFSHGYAFCFMVMGMGALVRELRLKIFPFWSALLFAAVALSHAYILLGLPWIYLASFLFVAKGPSRSGFMICLISGVFAILLSLWFLVPMVDNSPWTTAYFFKWISKNLLGEVFPTIFYPVLGLFAISLPLFFVLAPYRHKRGRGLRQLAYWLLPTVVYWGYYYLFPALGLVDVRAFPQLQMFICLLAAVFLSFCLRPFRIPALLASTLIIFLGLMWTELQVKNFTGWAKWNYSSWAPKPAYPGLKALSDKIRGDFSMPRVIYEHSMLNNKAGTERVFEMLPYFATRATLESVYLQASILGPAAFLLQAEISKTPSCPFEQYDCAPYDVAGAEQRLKIMGVGSLIMITRELRAQADAAPFLEAKGEFGQWKLYDLREQPALVEVFASAPTLSRDPMWIDKFTKKAPPGSPPESPRVPVDPKQWKDLFYYWLKNYEPGMPYVVHPLNERDDLALSAMLTTESGKKIWSGGAECAPRLKVDFDTLTLNTTCPGRAHLLKFAYHSSWKADTEDPIYLVSPGYMAIVPSKSEVTLHFGQRRPWRIAAWVSILSLLIFISLGVRYYRRGFLK